MSNLLDELYSKKYFIKKEIKKDTKNEPDYYVRHNKRIYLFENKDVLINKKVKSSGDIDSINDTLKSKFLEVNGKPIGIGQLIYSIQQIVENNFKYDNVVNEKSNFTIYPILLVSDRIFEIFGINYRLNKWYLELVKEKLGDRYNPSLIKNLTIIDIDTIIFWLPHLKKNDNNFRKIIDNHLKKMSKINKAKHSDPLISEEIARKNLFTQLLPVSHRLPQYKFPARLLIDKFENKIIER